VQAIVIAKRCLINPAKPENS
jgi:hypothetical protein